MEKKKRIYGGWWGLDYYGVPVLYRSRCYAPDMSLYLADMKVRRAAR